MPSFFKQISLYCCNREYKVNNWEFILFRNASNNFGPALNRHLKNILPLIKKKQDLASTERIHDLKETLIRNGGEEAEEIVEYYNLK